MNNLTSTQKDIISKLENEFQRINNEHTIPSNLLDIGSLMANLSKDKVRREEIIASNVISLKQFRDKIDNWTYQINETLRPANLSAWNSHEDRHKCIIYFGDNRARPKFQINVHQSWNDVTFKSKISGITKYGEGEVIEIYSEMGYKRNAFSLEELLKHDTFISNLKRAIADCNK